MTQTFFFYDLETSGLSPREDRIMQFAGQRTDLDMNPIGEPYNILVTLNDDTLPDPDALMVTGITPQQTVAEGYSEAAFAELLLKEVFTPGTIATGFNNIRFDDEFIRYLFWRTFHDPYAWTWRDDRSRWDLLDVVRMTRALRPEGIEWPFIDGKEANRLELITKLNGIDHFKAHDALSDVEALIAVTRLVKQKQPQLYDYLFHHRGKKEVMKLVNLENPQPFVYVNGRYTGTYHKASVAFPLAPGKNGNVVVYDLRYDPRPFLEKSSAELKKILFATKEERQAADFQPLPVQELQYNQSPAVAPVGVLEQAGGWERIDMSIDTVTAHRSLLASHPIFAENVRSLFEGLNDYPAVSQPEARLYDAFINERDSTRVETVSRLNVRDLADYHPEFDDERLAPLLLHYKARNFPKSLAQDEMMAWEEWRAKRLQAQLPHFVSAMNRLASTTDSNKQFIVQELQLWAESILPSEND